MARRKTFTLSDDMTAAFLEHVKEQAASRKTEAKPPTLKDFLNQTAVYEAIKKMLDDGLQWDVIASAINETYGVHLKTATVRSAYGMVAKGRGEPRKEIVARKIEERKRERERQATVEKREQQRVVTPQPAPSRPQPAPVRPQQQSVTA